MTVGTKLSSTIDPVMNLSQRGLSMEEKDALIGGLSYVFPTDRFDEETFIANVETLFVSLVGYCTESHDSKEKETDEEIMCNRTPQQLTYATKLRSMSDSFWRRSKREPLVIDKQSLMMNRVLRELGKDKTICVTHSDKGKGVIIMNRCDYGKKMNDILNATSTFRPIDGDPTLIKEDNLIRSLLRMEKRGFISPDEHMRM
ncbi:unnamed protein product [Didymodactylos carnosus]|uniref:Uncharacterized protein n=1 Tax=Didymodactylos carnosus TaxID=1234261 RepID=A0A814ZN19_9BILA|nr:unnamed protein product [Didymodactylos carnosus]CAF4011503.1 unnamed protein product [Didymodactylos carnosus]